MSLLVNLGVSLALYEPLGIAGIVIGTAVASAAMTVAQAFFLRRQLHGFEIGRTLRAVAGILVAGALLGRRLLRGLVRRSTRPSAAPCSPSSSRCSRALALGSAVYAAAVLALRIPEAQQIIGLIRGRMGRGAS